MAMGADGVLGERDDVGTTSGVDPPVFRRAAAGHDLFGRGLGTGRVTIGANHVGTELSHRVGTGLADARRGPQHDSDLAAELEELAVVLHERVSSQVAHQRAFNGRPPTAQPFTAAPVLAQPRSPAPPAWSAAPGPASG